MRGLICRALIVVVTWAVAWTAVPSAGAASGLFDWLANCGSGGGTPVTWYYPVTSTYGSSSMDCCAPTVCCDVPCPPMVMPEARPSLWQRLFGSCQSQQTSYRTNWTQIPVTSYRPAVVTDPITGCPVTVMQPCTTYTWQADRQRCGLFDRLCGRCDPGPTAVPSCPPGVMSAGMDCSGGIVTSDCCTETAGSMVPTPATPAPTPAPYYAPGAPAGSSVLPGASSPGSVPSVLPPVPPPPTGNAVPQPPATPPAADVRPSLKPAEDTPAADTLEAPVPAVPAPLAPLPSQSASAPTADTLNPSVIVPLPSLGPPRINGPGPGVSPVPDPDAAPADTEGEPGAPQLLNPRDQVALLRADQAWSYSTITWPVQRAVTPAARSPLPARTDRRWDESGWHSVRQ